MQILDSNDETGYTVNSKTVSIHDKTYITNAQGKEVAYILRKPISLHKVHTIETADGTEFAMNTKLFYLTDDLIKLDCFRLNSALLLEIKL